jgi:hypothetical protein
MRPWQRRVAVAAGSAMLLLGFGLLLDLPPFSHLPLHHGGSTSLDSAAHQQVGLLLWPPSMPLPG